jgi:Zn-dependent peptidase ImmA (M78 family)/DNA-binding XRE family transcriptional regulator
MTTRTTAPAFRPERLRLARQRRALTKVALAQKVGLTARRISAFENEGDVPPESTVDALASALRFPVGFFCLPEPPAPSEDTISFRSFSKLPAGKRDAALAASTLAIEFAAWVDERFRLPTADLPDLRDVDPRTAAVALRSTWALGDEPAPNMVHLLEAHGVRVYSLTDDCAALDGFSFWYDDAPFVFLTHHKSPERARWDAAHELAHLVLHFDGPPRRREREKEADAFAAEFLLPERGVRASAAPYPSLLDVRQQKLYWQVSALAYVRRLFDLGLLRERRYRSLIIEATQAGYRRHEHDIDHEVSQLVPKLLTMLREDGISIVEVANALELQPSELRGLLFSTLSVIDGGGGSGQVRTKTAELRAL